MVALHITDTLLSVGALRTDHLQRSSLWLLLWGLSTHGCPRLQHHQVHMAFAAPLSLAFSSLVLFHKTVGKCLSLLTPYAYRWCPMAKWPVSPVIAGCNTHPKQAGDSGLEESQSTQDFLSSPAQLLTGVWLTEPESFISFGEWLSQGPSLQWLSYNLSHILHSPSIRLCPCCGWNSSSLRLLGPTEAWGMARSTSVECAEWEGVGREE